MRRPTEEELNELAKEACWEDGGEENCKEDCATCKAGHWKHWKYTVKVIIQKWERMKNVS